MSNSQRRGLPQAARSPGGGGPRSRPRSCPVGRVCRPRGAPGIAPERCRLHDASRYDSKVNAPASLQQGARPAIGNLLSIIPRFPLLSNSEISNYAGAHPVFKSRCLKLASLDGWFQEFKAHCLCREMMKAAPCLPDKMAVCILTAPEESGPLGFSLKLPPWLEPRTEK